MHDVKAQLKDKLVPIIRELGFKGSFPHFRRIQGELNHLLTFQFDKYGSGRFAIELARAPRGIYKTYWGEEISESKLTAHHLAERIRLGSGHGGEHWFSIAPTIGQTVDDVVELLRTQGEQYFEASP